MMLKFTVVFLIQIVFTSVCVGQYYTPYSPPVIVQSAPATLVPSNPVVIAPPLYIDICGITERTREYKLVPYKDGKTRRVPVINGYVPGVSVTNYSNGAQRIVYNYSRRDSYEDVMRRWREKFDADRRKKEQPRLVPTPAPPKPKLVPVKPPSVLVKPEPKKNVEIDQILKNLEEIQKRLDEMSKPKPEPPKVEPKVEPKPEPPKVEPKPEPPKVEPKPEPPKEGFLEPVPPIKGEPRVVIPPSYEED